MRKKTSGLSPREKRFCEGYALGRDAAEAACEAGYERPEKAGVSLLSRDDINAEISRLCDSRLKNARRKAYSGFERIAFGSINDAVRLLFEQEVPGDAAGYDLFNVAEIRRPKEGALEIKFFDRLKALEKLEQYGQEDSDTPSDFYRALVGGVDALKKTEDGE